MTPSLHPPRPGRCHLPFFVLARRPASAARPRAPTPMTPPPPSCDVGGSELFLSEASAAHDMRAFRAQLDEDYRQYAERRGKLAPLARATTPTPIQAGGTAHGTAPLPVEPVEAKCGRCRARERLSP